MSRPARGERAVLASCPVPLAEAYDVALVDLDGVVYLGPRPVAGAADALAAARRAGMRIGFVTNNATRTPEAVAGQLRSLGVDADAGDVVTSSQAAVRLLRGLVAPGRSVLVVGGEGLRRAVSDGGYRVVAGVVDDPAAVVQGLAPGVGYDDLAEAALALGRGVPWVATNLDATLPTERGLAPGNGAYVALLRAATGREPEVAGKPYPALHEESVARLGAARPLVVGDRLDTDIAGATTAGCDSLHVLTGVHGLRDLAAAPPAMRPTYVGEDLSALLSPVPAVRTEGDWAVCGAWRARVADGAVELVDAAVRGSAGAGRQLGVDPAAGGRLGVDAAAGGRLGVDAAADGRLDGARATLAAAWRWTDAGGIVPDLPPALSGAR